MKNLLLASSLLILTTFYGCQKQTPSTPPTINLSQVSSITDNSAKASSEITADGGDPVTSRGVCWSTTNSSPTVSDIKTTDGSGTGTFVSPITGLSSNTTYYLRAYAVNGVDIAYSSQTTFKTLALAPTVSTTEASLVLSNSFTTGGNVSNDGGSPVIARGVCWGIIQNPTIADHKSADGTGIGSYVTSLADLIPGATYYVRAYAINSIGTAYGNEVTVRTSAVLPTIVTNVTSAITSTSATSGGNIASDGGAEITARGVCWSTKQTPTIADGKSSEGSGTGNFSSTITGLNPGTICYIRAYATNSIGTAYGNELSFTSVAVLPIVTTSTLSNISNGTASGGGEVTSDGGAAIIARGVCWSPNQNPTIADSKSTDGTGTGSFTSSVGVLNPGVTYFVRAYAINSIGTSYGNQLSFTTNAVLPTLTQTIVSIVTNITSTTASSGGNITSDGGSPIIGRGVCWSSNQNPTIADGKTTDGTGTGSFVSSITGLLPGKTYYVRQYATSNAGTAYGNETSFTTATVIPALTTSTVSNISSTEASSGGTISSDGGSPVTARGICWGTSSGPNLAGLKTSDGTGTGNFASSMTGLSPGTTYYVRSYATNNTGTAYGNETSFTTGATYPSIATTFVTNITASSASSGGNIISDGGSQVIARGICWSVSASPTISGNKTTDGSGIGSYLSSMTGLNTGSTYHVRAYATNNIGTVYGNEVTFTVLANLPIITTKSVYLNQYWRVMGGGDITSDGGTPVTSRGVCWSTFSNPTISNNKTSDGTGIGSYISPIEGLTPGTTYFARAYATNSAGTSYGNEVTFTALPILPTISTSVVTDVTTVSASCGGTITNDGGGAVIARGVCWGLPNIPTLSPAMHNFTTNGTGIGSFTSQIAGLTPGSTYYVWAYATNSAGTVFGNEMHFTALANLPVISTSTISNTTSISATSGGNITSDGGATISAKGVCWSTNQNPSVADSKTTDGTGAGIFTSLITGLTPGTTYYVRAYVTNSVGTVYGSQMTFTSAVQLQLPLLTTTAVTSITISQAISGGNISSDGGATITGRGICWSTSSNPTISNNKSTDGTGSGSFVSSINGLSPGTAYHVRSYATNSLGTAYGNEVIFSSLPSLPILTTMPVTNINETSGSSGGNITSDAGLTILARGVCWSTFSNPTISYSKTNDGTGVGSFTRSITNVNAGNTYHVRAYATTVMGTAYGNEVTFVPAAVVLTLTTTSVTNLTETSASSGGNITTDGGSPITARGICWGTIARPTTSNNKTVDGSGIGSYSSSITGLFPGTAYNVRAYATNSKGTTYGAPILFITPQSLVGTVSDIDGNIYSTVTIGTQVWMAQNLQTTKLNDNTSIRTETDNSAWINLVTPGYCWYNNDPATYQSSYGALYNWYAVNTAKLCPVGWHVPSIDEWDVLLTYVGSGNGAGGNLKETGTTHWTAPNTGATNNSGFTALPAGYRASFGYSYSIGTMTEIWSSSLNSSNHPRTMRIQNSDSSAGYDFLDFNTGLPVRCLKN